MNKFLLFFIALFMAGTASAVNVTINVDNAANVTVAYNNGYGPVIPLVSGTNNLDLENLQPLLISAVSPATLVDVEVNGSHPYIDPSGVRAGYSDGTVINIVTSSPVVSTGVTIDVDKASRVSIRQSNGYGAALDLTDGSNNFALDAVKNPLKITATEGNQIVSVSVDGEDKETANDGSYLVSVTEGCRIVIVSREIPADCPVTFSIVPEEGYAHLKVSVQGRPVALTGATTTLTIPFGEKVTLSCDAGYEISGFSCGTASFTETDGVYSFIVDGPMAVSMVVDEMKAPEGYALVVIESSDKGLMISEVSGADNEFVQTLGAGKGYFVKIGDKVRITTFTTSCFFKSVTCNGVACQPTENNEKVVLVPVEGKSLIKIETVYKVNIAAYETQDYENHTITGKVLIKDGENLVSSFYGEVGETVTLVALPEPGYKLDYIARIYPADEEKYYDTYTITAQDEAEGLVIFEGVFMKDEENKSYVLRGNSIYDYEGNHELIGKTGISYEGEEYSEIRLLEGTQVHLVSYARDDYYTLHFHLWGDPSCVLPQDYVVNGEDANDLGVIDIAASYAKKDESGIGAVETSGSLSYDASAQTLSSQAPVTVYSVSGVAVAGGDGGSISLSGLAAGVYVAVSGTDTLKILKR